MAKVNRYNTPAQQNLMDTYVPMPYKELMLAGQQKQNELDNLRVGQEQLLDQDFNFLDKDRARAQELRGGYETRVDDLADLYGTDLNAAKREFTKMSRDYKKDASQFGEIGAIQGSFDAYQAYSKKLNDAVAKGDLDSRRATGLLSEATNAYEGIGEGGAEGYSSFSGQRAADRVNYADWVKDNLDDIEANTGAYATASPDGVGYIWKDSGTDEVVSQERIANAANALAMADESLQYNITEGERLGLGSANAFNAAIYGAEQKYAYKKQTRSKGVTSDATALSEAKRKREEDITPGWASNTSLQNKDAGSGVENYNKSINEFTSGINNNNAEISQLVKEIGAIENTKENQGLIAQKQSKIDELNQMNDIHERDLMEHEQLGEQASLAADVKVQALKESYAKGTDKYQELYWETYRELNRSSIGANPESIDEAVEQQIASVIAQEIPKFELESRDEYFKNYYNDSKDYSAYGLSAETAALPEFTNMTRRLVLAPRDFNIKVRGADGSMVSVSPEFIQALQSDADFAQALSGKAIDDEHKQLLLSNFSGVRITEGDLTYSKFVSDDGLSSVAKTSNGIEFYFSPTEDTKKSYEANIVSGLRKAAYNTDINGNFISVKDRAAAEHLAIIEDPELNKEINRITDFLGTAKVATGSIVGAQPVSLGRGSYLHIAKGDRKNEVFVWQSSSSEMGDKPPTNSISINNREVKKTIIANKIKYTNQITK